MTAARVKRALAFSNYVVEKYGDVYAPVRDALSADLEAMRPREGLNEDPMPRTPAKVTQADIARAIRAMRAAGYPDVRVVFKDNAVIVEAAHKGSNAIQGPKREIEL
ncbi:hypothetical protein [Methylobacterium sp. J-067]|uniref:hypothetical protein n=1 Tax=Methylobacterium sp. J-067 TaxID=2836648 RepID=UPI001FBA5DC4|nr:hypothetical protein [Methylobacterium sp. J-067]MCJ2023959.1 hypothetical protein [Methylobacterium sp. J-067]